MSVLPEIRLARREIHSSLSYSWDNRKRNTTKCLVIQRTVRGSCVFRLDGKEQEVFPGHAMLFCHGEDSQYGLGPNSGESYECEYVIIEPGAGIAQLFEFVRTNCGSILRMEDDGDAHLILLQLILEFETAQPTDRIAHASTAYQLLLSLYREQGMTSLHRDLVSHGRLMLETRYREPKNLKEWCFEIGISREYFSREFTARHHENPADFLRRLRLQHAQSLLRISPHLPLADVASLSGFGSVQTFQRAYKRHYQKPASRERK